MHEKIKEKLIASLDRLQEIKAKGNAKVLIWKGFFEFCVAELKDKKEPIKYIGKVAVKVNKGKPFPPFPPKEKPKSVPEVETKEAAKKLLMLAEKEAAKKALKKKMEELKEKMEKL